MALQYKITYAYKAGDATKEAVQIVESEHEPSSDEARGAIESHFAPTDHQIDDTITIISIVPYP